VTRTIAFTRIRAWLAVAIVALLLAACGGGGSPGDVHPGTDPVLVAGEPNAFLLVRSGEKVVVTQVLDGYYSRVDNSVDIDFAEVNGEKLIEVSTSNSMPPSLVTYFFAIEAKTQRAVPRKIFRDGRQMTHKVYSAMLLGARGAPELSIIRNHRLASSFSAYEESDRGTIRDSDRRLSRIVYRWNGKFYASH